MFGRAAVLLLLLTGSAWAQFDSGTSDLVRRVRVQVSFANHTPCESSTRVVLVGGMGSAVAETFTDGECRAEFYDVPPGRYRVSVSGRDIANADGGDVEITPGVLEEVEVKAKRTSEPDSMVHASAGAFISVSDLGIPSGAAKEFGKANQSIGRQEWTKAIDRLHKAITIYPNYAAAYNNLGVAYANVGDRAQGREALQKAISINDHLAAAYVNLARIDIAIKNLPDAEALLNKASGLGGADAPTLVLLGYAQLMDQHLDEAIATSRKAHAIPQGQHAYLHLAAAHAFELKHQMADVISELQTYLREEPGSPRAEEVRKALATLQAGTH